MAELKTYVLGRKTVEDLDAGDLQEIPNMVKRDIRSP